MNVKLNNMVQAKTDSNNIEFSITSSCTSYVDVLVYICIPNSQI